MTGSPSQDRSICFIALSGVRVKSEELRELGMTLPGFVERGHAIASLPSLGLLTLAAHTPDSWQVEYREVDELPPEAQDELVAYGLVAISALTARIVEAYELADALRERGVTVVLGGLHVSALPEEAARHADAVVVGEGESAWPRLLADLERNELASLYDARSQPFNFADARVPRYDLLDPSRYNRLTLQTSRGCPLDCSFCGASRMISRYKRKSIVQVGDDLKAILELWKRPFIELADDNTFVSCSWGRELAEMLGDNGVRWFTETDISVADNDQLLATLAESGCAQLLIGFESPRSSSLAGLDSLDWKKRRSARYAEAIAKIQSHGISVNGCFVLGFDTDDESCFEAVSDFVADTALAEVQITILTPFPGTALFSRLKSEGRLLQDTFWDACTLFDVTFQPKQMTSAALEHGFTELMRSLYSDTAAAGRRVGFRKRLKEARA